MSTIEKSIEVNVPAYVAYSKWMRFEEHPRFMDGVKEVKLLDVKRFLWKAIIAGRDTEWEGEIYRTEGGSASGVDDPGWPYEGDVRNISRTLEFQLNGHPAHRV